MKTIKQLEKEIYFLYLYPPAQMWKIKEKELELIKLRKKKK